jgi:ornithine carbamoyltransferase
MNAVPPLSITMSPVPAHLTVADPLAAGALAPLLAAARALQAAQLDGAARPSLKGRIFAVLCAADEDDRLEIAIIDHAATELGARVAHIRPHLSERSDPHTIELTAHMLGRLYSAVLCPAIAPALRERLSAVAGIPILGGLDDPAHPVSQVTAMLGGGADERKFALQALLLRSVG